MIIEQLKQTRDALQKFNAQKEQIDFYNKQIADAREVKITKITDLFTKEEIELIKHIVEPKQKQCYRNAVLLAQYLNKCKYVEGYMTCCGLNIEHAYNAVIKDGVTYYIDITIELTLNREPSGEYVVIAEYDKNTAANIALKTGFYSSIYSHLYEQELTNKTK